MHINEENVICVDMEILPNFVRLAAIFFYAN